MVAVAAAKFETLASTKNTLAPLRVRDSKIKTKKTCQKNKNCYLASMTQAQFHNKVLTHYFEARNKKRNHAISQTIAEIESKSNEADQTKQKLLPKMTKGKAKPFESMEFYEARGVYAALVGLAYTLREARKQIFYDIDEIAHLTRPEWNGREPLREEVDTEKMYEILSDV